MWLSGVLCLDPTAATNCRAHGIDSAAVSYSLDLIRCHQEITDGPAARTHTSIYRFQRPRPTPGGCGHRPSSSSSAVPQQLPPLVLYSHTLDILECGWSGRVDKPDDGGLQDSVCVISQVLVCICLCLVFLMFLFRKVMPVLLEWELFCEEEGGTSTSGLLLTSAEGSTVQI